MAPPPSPDPAEVRGQLERILADGTFVHSERASRFLRYVVERALAGETDGLKEYAIGVDVFERGEQYDPRVDSIVRVEAGRLRSKVDEYYGGSGRDDRVLIRLRRGSYVPSFEYRPGAQTAATPTPAPPAAAEHAPGRSWRLVVGLCAGLAAVIALVLWQGAWPAVSSSTPIRIAVLPLASYSTEASDRLFADRLTDAITSELARYGTLAVTSRTSARQFEGRQVPLREIARELDAEVVMEGNVTVEGEHVRVNARLVRAASDRKFWVEEFTAPTRSVRDLARQVAAKAAAAVLKHQDP
jgi:TolB-like protein